MSQSNLDSLIYGGALALLFAYIKWEGRRVTRDALKRRH